MNLKRAYIRFSVLIVLLTSCTSSPYDEGRYHDSPLLKKVMIPLQKDTEFIVKQGAFGKGSHNEKGNEFQWDFEVPLGTDILSAEDGEIYYLYQPENPKGGCNPEYAKYAWGLHIIHSDGTVAQYLHVLASVKVGQKVKKGEVIGKTVWLGWICYPHVHFGIYRSKEQMYGSPNTETLPLYFEGIENGLLLSGKSYIAK